MALAAGAFVAAIGGFVGDRLGAAPEASGPRLWRFAAARLVPIQVASFVVLELSERALFADPSHSGGLLGEPVLWVGIAVQVLCALAGAAFLVLFARTIELIQELVGGRAPRAARSAGPLHPLRTQLHVRSLVLAAGGPTFRGPPATL